MWAIVSVKGKKEVWAIGEHVGRQHRAGKSANTDYGDGDTHLHTIST